jgi:hypothetical protein
VIAAALRPIGRWVVADSLGRYGLQVEEEPPPAALDPEKGADRSPPGPARLRLFEWFLLWGFVALEIGYLVALARLARRALWPLIRD